MARSISPEVKRIHLSLFFDNKRLSEDKKWERGMFRSKHRPSNFGDNNYSKGDILAANIGLAYCIPADQRTIHIPVFFKEKGYFYDDNITGNAMVQCLRRTRQRIANLFTSRPAGEELRIAVFEQIIRGEANMSRKDKREIRKMEKKAKEKMNQVSKKLEKERRKIKQNDKEVTKTETRENAINNPDVIIHHDVIADDPGAAQNCIGSVAGWISKWNQKRKEKRNRKKLVKFCDSMAVKIYDTTLIDAYCADMAGVTFI